ncbi:MAG: lysophospholipase [Clostridia bacterium]|nr:lysophospholipase [Clostridia bacterium]
MKTETFTIEGDGGLSLPAVLRMPEETPAAVLQITHGMTEHIGRYDVLADALTARGIAVAGFDLRGHGQNPVDASCASFGESGWDASLEDMHRFSDVLTGRFPETPRVMLGFSLGSFLVREYLNRYSDPLAGAVIAGTGHQPGFVLSIMAAIVKTQVKKAGFDRTTPLVETLSFGTYNKKFAPNRTPSDWLCSDEAQLDAYRADALCRPSISSGLFLQLLESMKRTGRPEIYANVNRDLPVLLLSGEDDPVGDGGNGVRRVEQAMRGAGMKNVTVKLFPGARHDIFHEEKSGTAEEVRTLLGDWILAETAKRK